MKLLGLAAVASTALVVTKLAGLAAISWWVVFAPVLVVGGITMSILCSVAVLALIVNALTK
jgi:polyferredoxin